MRGLTVCARVFVVAGLLLAAAMVSPPDAVAMRTSPAGIEYATDFGSVTFESDTLASFDSGTSFIHGSTSGQTFTGIWSDTMSSQTCGTPGPAPSQSHWGQLVFTFSADWSTFEGVWAYCEDPPTTFNWDGFAVTKTCGENVYVTHDLNKGDSGIGTSGDDVFLGTPGDDDIRGLGGDDRICADGGDDVIRGGAGNDYIVAGNGNDDIFAGGGADTIFGGDGDDTIRGQGGADTIEGGFGVDTISGGGAPDTILGQSENDVLSGQNGADFIDGGSGDDSIKGQTGPDELWGSSGADALFGGNGNDRLIGHAGIDSCAGNLGPADEASATTCESTPGIEILF